MAFTIIDASGPVISAKISGELGKSEVSQIQAAALDAELRVLDEDQQRALQRS